MVMSGRSVNLITLTIPGQALRLFSSVTDNCCSKIGGEGNESKCPERKSNYGPLATESAALPTRRHVHVRTVELQWLEHLWDHEN